jgi:hypothetical protein
MRNIEFECRFFGIFIAQEDVGNKTLGLLIAFVMNLRFIDEMRKMLEIFRNNSL